ncbi:LURP-one-related/scramblase family protein [Floricoccus penangensis]|uniref:LURP-one-related/scramblase family protein n=1 Tax=Floricoccus penangensis TaxID=1859475 RepID=UPI0020419E17|nr:LURP-one-related family protein [Floricoccus penangensis]URZ87993.1 LURP-one-related family protein [Floricoccus penangensis]
MKEYRIKQRFWSIGGKFEITDQYGAVNYYVTGSFMKIPKQFIITDSFGNRVSTITKVIFQFLPKFDVSLANGQNFRIKKDFTFFKSSYQIDGLGLSVKGDWWNMNFSLLEGNKKVASISQKWFKLTSTYDIQVYDEKYSDVVISLVIAIDYVKEQEASSRSASSSSDSGN